MDMHGSKLSQVASTSCDDCFTRALESEIGDALSSQDLSELIEAILNYATHGDVPPYTDGEPAADVCQDSDYSATVPLPSGSDYYIETSCYGAGFRLTFPHRIVVAHVEGYPPDPYSRGSNFALWVGDAS